MRLRRELRNVPSVLAEEKPLPRWYGISWVDHVRNVVICHPVPLNRILGWAHRSIEWLRYGGSRLTNLDAELAAARDVGFMDGHDEGYAKGRQDTIDETEAWQHGYVVGRRDGYLEGLKDGARPRARRRT